MELDSQFDGLGVREGQDASSDISSNPSKFRSNVKEVLSPSTLGTVKSRDESDETKCGSSAAEHVTEVYLGTGRSREEVDQSVYLESGVSHVVSDVVVSNQEMQREGKEGGDPRAGNTPSDNYVHRPREPNAVGNQD